MATTNSLTYCKLSQAKRLYKYVQDLLKKMPPVVNRVTIFIQIHISSFKSIQNKNKNVLKKVGIQKLLSLT